MKRGRTKIFRKEEGLIQKKIGDFYNSKCVSEGDNVEDKRKGDSKLPDCSIDFSSLWRKKRVIEIENGDSEGNFEELWIKFRFGDASEDLPKSVDKDKPFLKIVSWNMNGWSARKDDGSLKRLIDSLDPDIICLQETKIDNCIGYSPGAKSLIRELNPSVSSNLSDKSFFESRHPHRSLNGVMTIVKDNLGAEKLKLSEDGKKFMFGIDKSSLEGRIVAVRVYDFVIINVYSPFIRSNGIDVSTDRIKLWEPFLINVIHRLRKTVSDKIIVCGDLNMAGSDKTFQNFCLESSLKPISEKSSKLDHVLISDRVKFKDVGFSDSLQKNHGVWQITLDCEKDPGLGM